MLTVMCPNCRHRFPAPGCCNPGGQRTFVVGSNNRGVENEANGGGILSRGTMRNSEGAFYGGSYLLVPRDYNGAGGGGGGGCFINAPTIINGPTIIQQPSILEKIEPMMASSNETWLKVLASDRKQRQRDETVTKDRDDTNDGKARMRNEDLIGDCHIDTSCELTGGTVTITTPGIQSGGCLIRAKDTEILVQSPRIEIRPKVSLIGGGGCFVKKHHEDLRIEEASPGCSDDDDDDDDDDADDDEESSSDYYENEIAPPSGCQELPGARFPSASKNHNQHKNQRDPTLMSRNNELNARNGSVETKKRHSSCCCASRAHDRDESKLEANNHEYSNRRGNNRQRDEKRESIKKKTTLNDRTSGPMEIRVNATVQLPPSLAHCTLNITATTGSTNVSNENAGRIGAGRRDNFNGGGLVHLEHETGNEAGNERREEAPPTTPLSWLMPCPWGFDNYSMDKDATRLKEIKRLLQTSGWYHEGLSWQQSETLLENASLGRWLVRDSSDSRFVFAVSVQTPRGPTSVRVHYFLGRFRLDAEPRMSLAMPLFESPIKMLQHYVDYSKRIDEHRKEVWVDYSGQLYSQIYLTKPLVKEVQTLSHLARVAVNSYKLNTDYLPPLIKNYLAEYPYSL